MTTIMLIFKEEDSVKGFLKRWFVEVKPNVLISSISFSQVCDIVSFLDKKHREFEYIVISSANTAQGYKIIDKTTKNAIYVNEEGYFLRKIQSVVGEDNDITTGCGDFPM